jgi:hypothetical protein
MAHVASKTASPSSANVVWATPVLSNERRSSVAKERFLEGKPLCRLAKDLQGIRILEDSTTKSDFDNSEYGRGRINARVANRISGDQQQIQQGTNLSAISVTLIR